MKKRIVKLTSFIAIGVLMMYNIQFTETSNSLVNLTSIKNLVNAQPEDPIDDEEDRNSPVTCEDGTTCSIVQCWAGITDCTPTSSC